LATLARVLGAPEGSVRLDEQTASPLWRLRRALTGAPPPRVRDRAGPAGEPPFEAGPQGIASSGRGWPGRRRFAGGPEMPIFGDFAAALQRDDGAWTVVRSTPEPFPSAWQMEASAWLLAGFLLVASAGYLFSRRISAPLRRFAEAAESLGRDPHAPQMTLRGPAEIGMAAQAFNEMQS